MTVTGSKIAMSYSMALKGLDKEAKNVDKNIDSARQVLHVFFFIRNLFIRKLV